VELEHKLLAAHNYGTGLLQGGVPGHLRYQWAAANKLMACNTPTQLAHAIAACFPHSTYAVSGSPLHAALCGHLPVHADLLMDPLSFGSTVGMLIIGSGAEWGVCRQD
jgi:hypothetical protein